MGQTMTFVWRAALAMCIVFAGCLLGILLQHSLPTEHVADAKSAITTIQGLVGLLLALVLGLLVGTSYGVYFAAAGRSAYPWLADPAARSGAGALRPSG
jgi:phosphatidylserine synthase